MSLVLTTDREELIQAAIAGIKSELGGEGLAPRDRVAAVKAVLDLELRLLDAREERGRDSEWKADIEDLGVRIRAMGAELRGLRAENRELREQLAHHRETQKAWGSAGT